MSQISSPWHDMFQKYYDNAMKRIGKIRTRDNKVPYVEDEDNGCWQVEPKPNNEFIYKGKIKLRDILYRLQYFAHFNKRNTHIAKPCTITMNILGKDTKFKLQESKLYNKNRGWQILVYDEYDKMPTYKTIMGSLEQIYSKKLAKAILHALETTLEAQEIFEQDRCSNDDVHNVRMFILLTHIAEAAVPSVRALDEYLSIVKDQDGNKELKTKHGRTPMMDKIVRAKLKEIEKGAAFSSQFSEEAFPSQVKDGGTQLSREYALNGNETNTLSDIEDESDGIFQTDKIQDVTNPSSDIEGATGSSNDTDDLANSFSRMNVTAE